MTTFPDLPDWQFDVDEVSANLYRARGTDLPVALWRPRAST